MSVNERTQAVIVASMIVLVAWGAGFSAGQRDSVVPCEEDEVYVVAEDRNPSHGLAWRCMSYDALEKLILSRQVMY